ncbi:MAG: Mov34/MPN/PAD-1 family protein [Heteroscytonema crispum UTEX LB 1556]
MIELNIEQLQSIRTHAESTYPQECCGIILGNLGSLGKTVVEVIPTENAWNTEADNFSGDKTVDDQRRRYAIAPQVMLKVQTEARLSCLNIIGIYHSHPDHPAVPSECDREFAWQEYSYIIVSVPNGKAGDVKSWCLDDNHQFQPEAIQISDKQIN